MRRPSTRSDVAERRTAGASSRASRPTTSAPRTLTTIGRLETMRPVSTRDDAAAAVGARLGIEKSQITQSRDTGRRRRGSSA